MLSQIDTVTILIPPTTSLGLHQFSQQYFVVVNRDIFFTIFSLAFDFFDDKVNGFYFKLSFSIVFLIVYRKTCFLLTV